MSQPLVSIVVPAHLEELWIHQCVDTIRAQDYPHDRIEVVIVVDTKSNDQTERLARDLLEVHDFKSAEVIRNESGGTPANLNRALVATAGDIVCRVDARSVLRPDYVRRCVATLTTRPEVSVTGGTPVAIPGADTDEAVGIARAFNNRFAMGLSRHHRGARSGPSDTVYLGAFRAGELKSEGGWNEAFPTNQDFELNRRMSRRGIVWFDSALEVGYVTRPTIGALHRHFVRFGKAKADYWRLTGDRPRPRQVVLLAAPPVVCGATAYVLAFGSWRTRATLVTLLSAGAVAVETVGSRGPSGGLRTRGWAVVAIGACASGWLTGIARECLPGSSRG